MRVVIVDDDKDLNRQISDALVDAGYVVDRAFARGVAGRRDPSLAYVVDFYGRRTTELRARTTQPGGEPR